MKSGSRGQASLVDVVMFSIVVSASIVFLQIYSAAHSSTSVEDMKSGIRDEYAADVLQALCYVPPRAGGYETVQAHALTNVSDKDLEVLINTSLEIRSYTKRLDEILQNISRNISEARSETVAEIESLQSKLYALKSRIANSSNAFTSTIQATESVCVDTASALSLFAELLGGESYIPGGACSFFTEARSTITGYTIDVIDGIDSINSAVDDVVDAIDDETEEALLLIEDARCALDSVNTKTDDFISYAQLGVRAEATILDLLPARASLETKTLCEALGEAAYIENRLIGSDIERSASASGVRLGLILINQSLNESKPMMAQAIALTLFRRDYGEMTKSSVQEILDNLLTRQGYGYCFKAETCCVTIEAGECLNIPPESGHARRSFASLGKETGEMVLDIWKR